MSEAMRAAFEAHQRSRGLDCPASVNGEYCENTYQEEWMLWQAALQWHALSSPEVKALVELARAVSFCGCHHLHDEAALAALTPFTTEANNG